MNHCVGRARKPWQLGIVGVLLLTATQARAIDSESLRLLLLGAQDMNTPQTMMRADIAIALEASTGPRTTRAIAFLVPGKDARWYLQLEHPPLTALVRGAEREGEWQCSHRWSPGGLRTWRRRPHASEADTGQRSSVEIDMGMGHDGAFGRHYETKKQNRPGFCSPASLLCKQFFLRRDVSAAVRTPLTLTSCKRARIDHSAAMLRSWRTKACERKASILEAA